MEVIKMLSGLIMHRLTRLKFGAVVLALLLQASVAYSAGSSGLFNVSRVEVSDSFVTVYPIYGYAITGEACEDNTKMVFWKDDMPDGLAFVHGVALAALLAGNKVSAWVSGCKMGPWGKTLPHGHTLNIFPAS